MSVRKEYVQYLESIGFRKASMEEIEKYVPYEFEYIYDALWYIYDGTLNIDKIEMENLPLIITGDLNMPNGSINTVDYNGLVVLGKTNVKWLSMEGNTYLKDVTFSLALIASLNGAPRTVEKAKGPLIYHHSDSTDFEDVSEVDCYVYAGDDYFISKRIPNSPNCFCDTVKNPEKYIEDIEEWQLTEKQFNDNVDKIKDQYHTYLQYLVDEVGICPDEIERALVDGTFELNK